MHAFYRVEAGDRHGVRAVSVRANALEVGPRVDLLLGDGGEAVVPGGGTSQTELVSRAPGLAEAGCVSEVAADETAEERAEDEREGYGCKDNQDDEYWR